MSLFCAVSANRSFADRCKSQTDVDQTVYWILAASKGWIKETYRKIMHTQNAQNHITVDDLVQIE